MKHSLFVGHFDTTVRGSKPKVKKELDLEKAREIFLEFCDKGDDGQPLVAASAADFIENAWLGRIGQEDVLFRDGYLVCPWLSLNESADRFIGHMHRSMHVNIFEPGDATFFSPKQLQAAQRDLAGMSANPQPLPTGNSNGRRR